MDIYCSYVSSRKINGAHLSHKIQNTIYREYAKSNNIFIGLGYTEYIMNDCFLMLTKLINEISHYSGVIFYSYNQLESQDNLIYFIKKILSKNKSIHFVNENLVIRNRKDVELLLISNFIDSLNYQNLLKINEKYRTKFF